MKLMYLVTFGMRKMDCWSLGEWEAEEKGQEPSALEEKSECC